MKHLRKQITLVQMTDICLLIFGEKLNCSVFMFDVFSTLPTSWNKCEKVVLEKQLFGFISSTDCYKPLGVI